MNAATLDDPADMELQHMTREDYVHKIEQEGLRVSARSTVDLTMHAEKGMRKKKACRKGHASENLRKT